VVPIEGTGSPARVSTPNTPNSCSTNSVTGETVCVANNTDIYLLTGTALTKTLTSSSDTTAGFSGGDCQNCGVAVNSTRNQAVIQIGYSSARSGSALQFLDLGHNALGTPVPANNEVSEDILWDPFRNLILSPDEGDNYDLFQVTTPLGVIPDSKTVTENSNQVSGVDGEFDSAGEDCSTGVALATDEGGSDLYVVNLDQVKFSSGTWSAPSQLQYFPEFSGLSAGPCPVAVAPGTTHLGIVSGEFGGATFAAIELPSSSVSGVPSVLDYAYATMPNTPDGDGFSNGYDPHTTTAYTSPNSGKAYGVMASWASGEPAYVGVIDLKALLAAPRSGAHTVDPSYDLIKNNVVRYVATF